MLCANSSPMSHLSCTNRDFNINALFYNINDGCVEDFTGRGVKDLQAGLLCTPLPADVTFHDDPLRVLRAIRFASRLNYTLDWSLIAAARQEVIRVAMQHKVSRERVCKEIDGMLQHSNARPALSAMLLHDLGMLDVCLPLHLYLSAEGSASGSTSTAPIPHYRVSRYCHPLCSLWFDDASGTVLQQCAACREYQCHSKELATCSDGCLNWPCWMSMSVEVTMWVQALLRHKFQAIAQASSSDLHWIPALRQQLAWRCRGADLTDVNVDLNTHCEAENNAKILFWSSLLSVTGGITIQEVHVAPPTAPGGGGGGKKGQQHQQQHVPKDLSLSERILREQLKMDNHTAKGSQVVLDAALSLLELLQLDEPQAIVAFEHVSVADYIANYRAETVLASRLDILSVAHWLRTVKERWEDALVVAWGFVLAWIHRHRPGFTPLYRPYDTASRLEEAADVCFAQLQSFLAPSDPSRSQSVLVMVLDRFATFIQAIDAHRLRDIWLMKPLLDGGALQRHLQAKGPIMGKLMEAQILWQIQYRFSFATAEETTAALVAHLHTVLAEEMAHPSFTGKTR